METEKSQTESKNKNNQIYIFSYDIDTQQIKLCLNNTQPQNQIFDTRNFQTQMTFPKTPKIQKQILTNLIKKISNLQTLHFFNHLMTISARKSNSDYGITELVCFANYSKIPSLFFTKNNQIEITQSLRLNLNKLSIQINYKINLICFVQLSAQVNKLTEHVFSDLEPVSFVLKKKVKIVEQNDYFFVEKPESPRTLTLSQDCIVKEHLRHFFSRRNNPRVLSLHRQKKKPLPLTAYELVFMLNNNQGGFTNTSILKNNFLNNFDSLLEILKMMVFCEISYNHYVSTRIRRASSKANKMIILCLLKLWLSMQNDFVSFYTMSSVLGDQNFREHSNTSIIFKKKHRNKLIRKRIKKILKTNYSEPALLRIFFCDLLCVDDKKVSSTAPVSNNQLYLNCMFSFDQIFRLLVSTGVRHTSHGLKIESTRFCESEFEFVRKLEDQKFIQRTTFLRQITYQNRKIIRRIKKCKTHSKEDFPYRRYAGFEICKAYFLKMVTVSFLRFIRRCNQCQMNYSDVLHFVIRRAYSRFINFGSSFWNRVLGQNRQEIPLFLWTKIIESRFLNEEQSSELDSIRLILKNSDPSLLQSVWEADDNQILQQLLFLVDVDIEDYHNLRDHLTRPLDERDIRVIKSYLEEIQYICFARGCTDGFDQTTSIYLEGLEEQIIRRKEIDIVDLYLKDVFDL